MSHALTSPNFISRNLACNWNYANPRETKIPLFQKAKLQKPSFTLNHPRDKSHPMVSLTGIKGRVTHRDLHGLSQNHAHRQNSVLSYILSPQSLTQKAKAVIHGLLKSYNVLQSPVRKVKAVWLMDSYTGGASRVTHIDLHRRRKPCYTQTLTQEARAVLHTETYTEGKPRITHDRRRTTGVRVAARCGFVSQTSG